ncbi:MAG TPA: NtaA/DmoA family FMN-dependent monooxygenase [Pseudolysinimonas sp.]|nr:NtaA/DmoA family FMN-dependent monooxygenase [Pseudolysinimonas sp.]
MSDNIHFGFFSSFSPPAWHAAGDRLDGDDWPTGAYHSRLARRVEDAAFDFLFFEDTASVSRMSSGTMDADLTNAFTTPKNDPVALITYLAAQTSRLGLVATGSTSLYPPYLLARLYSTIDSLSNGRAGWNIVTSSEDESAQNFGQDCLPPTAERYAIAEEFVEVVSKLWDSWEEGAVVKDLESNIYADASKVHEINHIGENFRVRGPLNCLPSPQKRPVFAQAGGSDRGRDFAAKHAELIMSTVIGGVPAMTEFREDIHARMASFGRDPREARIMYALHAYIGEGMDAFRASITDNQLRSVLGKHGAHIGVDFGAYDLDTPFPSDAQSNGTTSMLESMKAKGRQGITLRDAIIDFNWPDEIGAVGKAADVARNLDDAMREAGGDGYIIMATQDANESHLNGIFDELVPELQRRGTMRDAYTGQTLRENLFAF